MYAKNRMLLALFGKDFIYPPMKDLRRNIDVTSPKEATNI